jgi:hypothetical protein
MIAPTPGCRVRELFPESCLGLRPTTEGFDSMRSRVVGIMALVVLFAVPLGWFAMLAHGSDHKPGAPKAEDRYRHTTLNIRAVKERVCRGDRVAIECEFANQSDKLDLQYSNLYDPPYFDAFSPDVSLYVNVTRNGKKLAKTEFGSHCTGGFSKTGELPHRAKAKWRLTVNAVYDMTLIGEYRITASIPVSRLGEADGRLIKSGDIKVFVDRDCL